MSKNLFITGTGTEVGKTYITGLITKRLKDAGKNAGYYKAAVSGNRRDLDNRLIPGDALAVRSMSGLQEEVENMVSYVYEAEVSPHLAAKIEGNPVCMEVVKRDFQKNSSKYDYLTLEGSGGIVCPIRYDERSLWLVDIIHEFETPCLIVADAGLGTINSVVLTVEYMRSKNIEIKGIIFNNYHPRNIMEEDNIKMIEEVTGIDVISKVQRGDRELKIELDKLIALYK
ncbi:dethiobiotin synthase [Anaerosacchariphilus polymeriproducens]|uniref:ATP-dependent dethiobiotin synthetase BioD n=1 Tax=Anaerosacchariphilus polymeriproducens TaxID=1812858 RepID=A0A371AVW6_9FIRM|nr:dethiobiotin synthase [Anaerosacchariphilus polymeriproducens]RDU23620.1 dethiobiotin synthase [Anaerosacchariphilus polymeriproducens]